MQCFVQFMVRDGVVNRYRPVCRKSQRMSNKWKHPQPSDEPAKLELESQVILHIGFANWARTGSIPSVHFKKKFLPKPPKPPGFQHNLLTFTKGDVALTHGTLPRVGGAKIVGIQASQTRHANHPNRPQKPSIQGRSERRLQSDASQGSTRTSHRDRRRTRHRSRLAYSFPAGCRRAVMMEPATPK